MFRMPSDLVDREERTRIYGVTVGIVTDNADPDGGYRVKVRFPWLPNGGQGGENSAWARIASPGAGGGKGGSRGLFMLPEIDDEVLVAFEHGDISRPYVVGNLWNGVDKPHLDNKGKKNNKRTFVSRSGHKLEFDDDKDGKMEKIVLQSASKARVVIDDSNNAKKIEIYDEKGDNYVLIDTQNKKITLESKTGEILLKAKDKIRLESKVIETKSDQDTILKSGANFKMYAGSNMNLKASSNATVESGSTMTIKGATVNIN